MNDNCFKCANGIMMSSGGVWCSLPTCNYEKGKPTIYKYEGVNAIKKGKRK